MVYFLSIWILFNKIGIIIPMASGVTLRIRNNACEIFLSQWLTKNRRPINYSYYVYHYDYWGTSTSCKRNMTEQLCKQCASSLKLIENVQISTFRSPLCSCLLNENTVCSGNESVWSYLPLDIIKLGIKLISHSHCSLRLILMWFIRITLQNK